MQIGGTYTPWYVSCRVRPCTPSSANSKGISVTPSGILPAGTISISVASRSYGLTELYTASTRPTLRAESCSLATPDAFSDMPWCDIEPEVRITTVPATVSPGRWMRSTRFSLMSSVDMGETACERVGALGSGLLLGSSDAAHRPASRS